MKWLAASVFLLAIFILGVLVLFPTGCASTGLQLRRPVVRRANLPAPCTKWNKLPLTVAFDPTAASVYYANFADAMTRWERLANRELFVLWSPDSQDPPDVKIEAGDNADPKWQALTYHVCAEDGTVRHTIVMHNVLNYQTYLVALHELGHVLGVGHSEVEESIMYPIPADDLMRDEWDKYMVRRLFPVEVDLALSLPRAP